LLKNFRCRGVQPSINLNSFYKENSRTITAHISISKTGHPLREGWCLPTVLSAIFTNCNPDILHPRLR